MTNTDVHDECPDLGLAVDPDTAYNYSSTAHICYHNRRAAWVKEGHQDQYCLDHYDQCPVYRGQPYAAEAIFSGSAEHVPAVRRWARAALLAGLVMLMFIGLGGQFWVEARAQATESAAPEALSAITVALGTWTRAPLPVTPTVPMPTVTWTALPTSGPDVGTPVGPFSVMLYVVKPGDSLASIASSFGTRVGVLVTANGLTEPLRIFPGQFLVVPVGVQDGAGLPRFVPYRVAQQPEALASIAAQFGAEVAQIRTINNLGPGGDVPQGRLLLIPVTPLPASGPASMFNGLAADRS